MLDRKFKTGAKRRRFYRCEGQLNHSDSDISHLLSAKDRDRHDHNLAKITIINDHHASKWTTSCYGKQRRRSRRSYQSSYLVGELGEGQGAQDDGVVDAVVPPPGRHLLHEHVVDQGRVERYPGEHRDLETPEAPEDDSTQYALLLLHNLLTYFPSTRLFTKFELQYFHVLTLLVSPTYC